MTGFNCLLRSTYLIPEGRVTRSNLSSQLDVREAGLAIGCNLQIGSKNVEARDAHSKSEAAIEKSIRFIGTICLRFNSKPGSPVRP